VCPSVYVWSIIRRDLKKTEGSECEGWQVKSERWCPSDASQPPSSPTNPTCKEKKKEEKKEEERVINEFQGRWRERRTNEVSGRKCMATEKSTMLPHMPT